MSGGRGRKYLSKTVPKRSQLTNSSFLKQVYDIEDAIGKLEVGADLAADRDDIVQQLRDLAEETQGNLDNMPEGLQSGPTGELLAERVAAIEAAADELENVELDGPEDDASDEDKEAYWEDKLSEIQGISIEAP